MKYTVMFAGQGSQFTNMGSLIVNKIENKSKVETASKILGYDVLQAIKNENNELSQTLYTQSLIALISMLLFDEVKKLQIEIDSLVGFSLGEIVTLYASNILSFEDTLRLVKYRAELMEEATIKYPGKMAAVINFDEKKIREVCTEVSKRDLVLLANFNSKKQVVISGTKTGVDFAILKLKELGARRIIELNVSGGFHTPLMKEAGFELSKFVETLNINRNIYPIYLNSSSEQLDYKNLNVELEKQVQMPVLFYQSIEKIIKSGINNFIEIGPGNVLSNLVIKNYDNTNSISIQDYDDIDILKGVI